MPQAHRRLVAPLAVLALVVALPLAGHANEGFWPFNRLPRAAIKQALGVDLSDRWIERVQQASVRFPSRSGAFVSRDGLVLTNHHVSLDLLHQLSTAARDLAGKGFLAATRAEEIKAPDLELLTLQKIDDVTARVNAAVKPAMSPAGALAARRSVIAAIEKDAMAATGLEAEVVTLYQGGLYHLYLYRKFTDVRLVFAPEFDAAFYGGDPDNDDEVLAVERDAYARIAQAVFATQGDSAYPEATFTLRLSYGQVKGYVEDGKPVAPFTAIRGLYVRGDEHKQRPPYKIADSWMKARGTVNSTTPFNFVSTNDIVGGNSASPVINAAGELVGLIFDGNIQSLPGYFGYDSAVNRAVSVDARGMLEAFRAVYKADAIVKELVAASSTPAPR